MILSGPDSLWFAVFILPALTDQVKLLRVKVLIYQFDSSEVCKLTFRS